MTTGSGMEGKTAQVRWVGLIHMGFIGSFYINTKLHADPIKLVLSALCHLYCIVYEAKFNIFDYDEN